MVQAVVALDFSLSSSTPSQTLAAGATTSYTISITRAGGFSGTVSLSVSGLPAGASGFFAASADGMGLVVSTTKCPPGSYPLTITATLNDTSGSPTRTHSTTATLVVAAP